MLLAVAPLAASPSENSAVQPAQPVTTAEPKYPYLQRHAEGAAQVTVAFTVDTQGKVTGANITNSSNYEFNEATLAAIKQWTFAPALKDGKPVKTRLQQTFVFSVRDLPEASRKELVASKKNAR
jgi:protein TonB